MKHWFVAGLVGLLVCGCSRPSGPAVVPVSGTVTFDGKPLKGATLRFIPTGATPGGGANGFTKPDGTYELTGIRGGAGTSPGEYKVVISKRVNPDGSAPDPNIPPIESPAKEVLPPQYSDESRSTLTKTVPEKGGTIDFALLKAGR